MKLYRKIDTQTGNFIEDVLFESHPFLMEEQIVQYGEWVHVLDDEGQPIPDPQYVEEAPKQGFYIPKWNGESWEEGATQEYIDSLKPEPIWVAPSIEEKNRADIIYLAVMTGVEL